MNGSPKQIAWAEKIRTKTILLMRRELADRLPREGIEAVVALAARQADARWWIDNQSLLASGTIQDHMLMKAAGLVDKAGVLTAAGVAWATQNDIPAS